MSELVYDASGVDAIAAVHPNGIEQEGTYCPDCQRVIPGDRDAFVSHRELEHPPAVHGIAGAGAITSQETVGSPGGGR